jgi:release factor glutamine methyltransferase
MNAPEPTLAQRLAHAQTLGLERLDAQLLLLHVLGRAAQDRAWLLAHDSDALPAAVQTAFDACVQRRLGGEPVAYITGHKEFYGLDLLVDERVLVPRPDTETLVEWALSLFPLPAAASLPLSPGGSPPLPLGEGRGEGLPPQPHILDLGTGSGAIALAIKHARPEAQVSAVDASTRALQLAQANARRLQLPIEFMHGSWLSGINERYHLIVSNPPYIAALDPHLQALRHEPLRALASGTDGLDDIRDIIAQARAHLQPGGWLLLEHGWDQAQAVRDLLLAAGFEDVQSRRDLSGIERCSGGRGG